MSNMAGVKGGPTCKMSFNETLFLFARLLASKTILILVDNASFLMTGWCGSFPPLEFHQDQCFQQFLFSAALE